MTPLGISFVLPMFNESACIEATLGKVDLLARELCDDYEVIVVDDCSTDDSAAIVERLAKKNERIVPIRLKANSKFGGALSAGLKAAVKSVVIYTDSDFPVREHDVKGALALLERGADVVTGYSLVIKDNSLKRIIISKVYNIMMQHLFRLNIRDLNSGFKIYKKEVLQDLTLRSRSPFIDVEIFSEAKRRGFKITQYGLIFQLRTKGKSTISRPSVIIRTFFDLCAYRFFHETAYRKRG